MRTGEQPFDLYNDRVDGYLRINTNTSRTSKSISPITGRGILFVDLEGPVVPDVIVPALHQEPLMTCAVVIFRTPWFNDEGVTQDANALFGHEPLKKFLKDCGVSATGVVKFHLGQSPVLIWAAESDPGPSFADDGIVANRILRAEMRALLEYGHAIWQPRGYHYELPSGDHTDSFVRIADAFRTPRDVEVFASWFVQFLSEEAKEVAIVLDSASLIPVSIELRRILSLLGGELAGTVTLDTYPATSLDIQQAVQSIGPHDSLLAILSVNASGRYKSLIFEALQQSQDPRLVVVLDKNLQGYPPGLDSRMVSGVELASLISIGRQDETVVTNRGECALCQQNDVAQTVRIDSRSFNAFALPQDNLLMPNVGAAKASRRFFDLCDSNGVIDIDSSSQEYIRAKQPRMGIKFRLDRLVAANDAREVVLEKISELDNGEQRFDAIVVSHRDMENPAFNELARSVAARIGQGTEIATVDWSKSPLDGQVKSLLEACSRPLILTLGSVSGWLLRRLQLIIQDVWHEGRKNGQASALIIHARPTSGRKWENLSQSFENRLHFVWKAYVPDWSPHWDEFQLLTQSNIANELADYNLDHEDAMRAFIAGRIQACSGADDSVNPKNIFWSYAPESRLRNTSVYGTRIDAMTTFAAVACAIQSTRQDAKFTDPRWPVFDFVSIGRSYFDGMLVATMLRWCAPTEVWWGPNPTERVNNISWLIRNTQDSDDQLILFPEMILAAAQGKIPDYAVVGMCDAIAEKQGDWTDDMRVPILCALVLAETQLRETITAKDVRKLITEIDGHQ